MGMLGLDRDAQGNGLTPADHQQVIRSEWAADGILSGCEVIASSSAMSVTVKPGAVVLPVSGTGAVMGPTPQTVVTFDAAPATGQDVYDILVSCENAPGASARFFKVKNGNPPPLAKRIERWVIPAGVTNAQAGYAQQLKDYAVPTGAGQARRVDYQDKVPFGTLGQRTTYRNLTSQIYLGQDRMLDFRVTQSFSSQEGKKEGSFQWVVRDSVHGLVTSPVLRYDAWQTGSPITGSTQFYSHVQRFAAGWHTLTWDRVQVTGEIPVHVGGQAPAGQGLVWRPFNRLEVVDLGVAY